MLRDLFSQRVALPLLDLRRRLLPSRRSKVLAADYSRKFRDQNFSWSDEARRKWVLCQLRSVLRKAATHTSYYRELFHKTGFDPDSHWTFDDFATIPVLDRSDILTNIEALISNERPKSELRKESSGGSTGEPVKIWVGPNEDAWNGTSQEYFMRRIGLPPGSRAAHLWGHNLDPVGSDSMNERLLSLCYNYRWFDCFRLSPEVLNRYHIEMTKYQPECIVAYASALAAFAQFLRENGLKPTYPCKCIVTGAEKLFDAQRELAESVFGKPIYERYGARDAGSMGFQLDVPQSKNLTIDWPNVFIEPETSEPESAILVTKLQADGTLMIRYRIGDLARFPDGSKPGHPVFELLSVVGRATERIWLPAGAFISGNQFPHLFKDFPVREFMVVQQEDFSVQVKILPDDKFSSAAETEILQTIAENLPGLQVKVAVVDAIPRTAANKWRPVVSYVASQKRVESQT